MKETGDFLLQLYRAARECGPDAFQSAVFDKLQHSFAFTAAFWGAGCFVDRGTRIVPTALCARNVDPQFLVDWSQVQHDDPVVPRLRSQRGTALRVHAPSFYAAQPVLAALARRYRIQSMTVVAMPCAEPRSIEWLSLFRDRPDDLCSDAQRRWLEHVTPHLGQAWLIHRALQRADAPEGDAHDEAIAVAESSTGRLLCAAAPFLALMACEWSGFDGVHAPAPLKAAWEEHRPFVHLGRHCRVDGRSAGELVYIAARPSACADALTQRQAEIAGLYAQGLSSKQIAQRCGLSPATVRNHLATVYATLGVHGKLEMARRLARLRA